MPRFHWPVDPSQVSLNFASRHGHPASASLLIFAVSAVDSLYYLADLDGRDDLSRPTIHGHATDIVDVAHARWATGTCITALDLCAAALGRALCSHTARRELGVSDFMTKKGASAATQHRAVLPQDALRWIDGVLTDGDYAVVKAARDALTHARVIRHFSMSRQRLGLETGPVRLGVPALLACATGTATKHLCSLLDMLPSI